eukprot:TRINITY_DN9012_c0_g2_i1.p2 TRINITY_DN9012_c0_g2~~TRINITY_DN9012_c0_g2_i1.p2  ORF type:complete len:120 (-),score=32.77 TRINITY_DN9012_c0_g2_i1:20-340(-)
MARRSASVLLSLLLCLAASAWLLSESSAFVAPQRAPQVAEAPMTEASMRFDKGAQAVVLAAALAAPQAAYAGNGAYALLQLGWAIFIISLGPAVLFWIYFNKPELL